MEKKYVVKDFEAQTYYCGESYGFVEYFETFEDAENFIKREDGKFQIEVVFVADFRTQNFNKTSTNHNDAKRLLSAVAHQKIDLIKEYLDPTGVTITELIDRNALNSLCQLMDAYLLVAAVKCNKNES